MPRRPRARRRSDDVRTSPGQRQDHQDGNGDDRLGRGQVAKAAPQRGVGEHLRRRADHRAERHVAEAETGQAGAVVDDAVGQRRHDSRLHDRHRPIAGEEILERPRASRKQAADMLTGEDASYPHLGHGGQGHTGERQRCAGRGAEEQTAGAGQDRPRDQEVREHEQRHVGGHREPAEALAEVARLARRRQRARGRGHREGDCHDCGVDP